MADVWDDLFRAAMDEDEDKLDQLVLQKADLDIPNKYGNAVLHKLAFMGSAQGIGMLIQRGADVNIRHRQTGKTPLHTAVVYERAGLVQKLIELGADVHATDNERPSGIKSMPLHLVANFGSGSNHSIDILKLLVKHGGSSGLRTRDADGDTSLHCAAANSNHGIMMKLLDLASESVSNLGFESTSAISSVSSVINLPNHKGQTPLHYAVESSANIENARRLLDVGAAVNARDAEGATPLHLAAGKRNLDAIRLLLGVRANKSIRDVYGATAFHYAARSGSVDVLRELLNEDNIDDLTTANQLTALHYAAWNKRKKAVKWLLEHKASVDVIDALKGDTPLHLAARRGDADVIQMLIQMGGANTQLTNRKGSLALGLADDRGHHSAAEAFVKAIREQNSQDNLQQNRQEKLLDSLLIKHSGNGATLLHYFAAYGAEEDMEWILKMVKQKTFDSSLKPDVRPHPRGVDMCDASNRNAVHWAAMRGNTQTLKVLAKNHADLNADANAKVNGSASASANVNDVCGDSLPQTPLYFALMAEKKTFADELMKLKSEDSNLRAQDWTCDISRWMMDYCSRSGKLEALRRGFEEQNYPPDIVEGMLSKDIPPIYLALYAERDDVACFIQQHRKGKDGAVNERGWQRGRTALHWATLLQQREIVTRLCRTVFKDDLIANVEDKCGKTALQYAMEMGESKDTQEEVGKDIEKELMQRSDVSAYIDALYKDRQVHVDATNAILVGAALIAGVTFAGWLQPPLGYVSYYNLPKLSGAEDAYQTYAAIQQHAGVRWFWIFNALSFSFAIATVVAGLVAVVPRPGVYIATSVAHLRRCLLIASALLGHSVGFVLVAFAAAGFAVLPPLFKYQAFTLATTIVGTLPCLLLLAWFWHRLPPLFMTKDGKTMWKLICSFCHHRGQSMTQGADSNRPFEAGSSIQTVVDVDTRPQLPKSEESTVKDDEDYKIGEDYDEVPWDDGLNVLSNVKPPTPTS